MNDDASPTAVKKRRQSGGTDALMASRAWRGYAAAVVWARWIIVPGWVGIAAVLTVLLPTVSKSGTGGFGSLIPSNSAAVQAQQRSQQEFGLPLLVDTIAVAHDPDGLPAATLTAVIARAAHVDAQLPALQGASLPTDRPIAAVPIPNTAPVIGHGKLTTVLTYLYFAPSLSLADRTSLAQQYAGNIPAHGGTRVAVTGTIPASVAQANEASGHLRTVEIATVLFVFVVVAITFRSLIAPLVTLAGALLSYLIAMRVLGLVGEYATLSLPPPLEPLIVALLLGILTDYSVFYFTETRIQLSREASTRTAIRGSLTHNSPIIAVAGLTVTLGTAALYVSRVQVYRVFGPGLAISVIVGVLVALSFVPAAMAILGRRLYWPSHPGRSSPDGASDHSDGTDQGPKPSWLIRRITTRPGAAVATALAVAGLLAAAVPLTYAQLDISFIRGLPTDAPARAGARAAEAAFPAGVLAPTVVLVEGADVTSNRNGLARLQTELQRSSGVAAVIGPADDPLRAPHGVVLARDGRAARYLVILDHDPLGGPAITTVTTLTSRGPALLSAAGLKQARLTVAGETAIAAAAARETAANLRLVLLVAFAVEFVVIAVYLRALLAPLLLLAASALVVGAALGLTTLVFQDALHSEGLTFYAPFATAVLLVALGSDYNVFGVGRIWEYARTRALRAAMRAGLPESTRAIATAGIVLAGSFAMVAWIPLLAFREMAFTMVVGLLLDTFIVRSIMTPSLLTLVGPVSGWPGHRLQQRSGRAAPAEQAS